MNILKIAISATLALIVLPAEAKVVYEDQRIICYDTSGCKKKMTLEDVEKMRPYLNPGEQRDLDLLKEAYKNPEVMKQILTGKQPQQAPTPQSPKDNVPKKESIGTWAQTKHECADEEGPNTRTIISLDHPKIGPRFEQYENICRINEAKDTGNNTTQLSLTCYEFLENLETNTEPEQRKITLETIKEKPDILIIDGAPFVRCAK